MSEQSKPSADGLDRLAEKIEAAKYRIGSARTWAGTQWGLPHLSPHKQQEVLDLMLDSDRLLSQLREELAQRDAEIEGLNAELDHVRSGRSELQARVNALESQQAASVGGEEIQVVGVRISSYGFGYYIADSAMGLGAMYPGDVRDPLMTVAQHERIVAAHQPAARHDQGDEARRLREALERARYAVERGEYATGCCCCGSSVASHGLGDGHSPVDEGDYFKLNVLKDIDAALTHSQQGAEE